MHRQIAGRLTGPVSKWIVVVLWLVALAVAGPLAGKLSQVQNNEQSSWLPQSAESTKALKRMDAFQSPNVFPTVLVYEARAAGRSAPPRSRRSRAMSAVSRSCRSSPRRRPGRSSRRTAGSRRL